MISINTARRAIDDFCAGATKDDPDAFRPKDEQLEIQAKRARDVARILKKEKVAILADPTGTGKTAMALAAARCLIEDGSIDAVVVIAPNHHTLERWHDRASWSGFTDARMINKKRRVSSDIYLKTRVSFTTSTLLRKPNFPTAKEAKIPAKKILFIIDEAHRGFGNAGSKSFEEICKVTKGAQVLSVTATPVQLDSNDLTTLLRLNGHVSERQLEDVKRFALDVTRILEDPDAKVANTIAESMSRADKVLSRFMLDRNPTKIPKPKFAPAALDSNLDPDTVRVLHVLRMLAGLDRGGGGDRYYQAIVSSWRAVRESSTWQNMANQAESDPNIKNLLGELERHMARPHPQVESTTSWIEEKIEERPRNILVFTWSTNTQPELAKHLTERLSNKAEILAPKTKPTNDQIKRFREKPANDRSLILVARNNLSESIDLDGGNPCLVHHDLDWNPVRMTQRLGRIVRISSGFEKIAQEDVYFPHLDLPGQNRLRDMLAKRIKFAEAIEQRNPDALKRLGE